MYSAPPMSPYGQDVPVSRSRTWHSVLLGLGFVIIFTAIAFVVFRQSSGPTRSVERFYNYKDEGGVNKNGLIATNAPQEYAHGSSTAGPTMNPASKPTSEPTNLGASASNAISASSAVILADMGLSEAKISTPFKIDSAQGEGTVMEDIKYATKGDGQIRPVSVNKRRVSDDFVKLAMFENQDFMYHLQHPNRPMPHLLDPSNPPQKSMFRKMTYPLVWERGTLGSDVIGNTNDTRVTISFTGGRPYSNA